MEKIVFKGVTVREMVEQDAGRMAALDAVVVPEVVSWRAMAPPISPWGNFLWTARPPGTWVSLVRYEDELISSSASIPLDVDYAKVYEMLPVQGSALLARVSDMGLVAVAVWHPTKGGTPLAPGFKANTKEDVLAVARSGVLPAGFAKAMVEELSEEGHDWPDGLMEPWVLWMKSAHDLGIKHEEYVAQTQGNGIWLLTAAESALRIYEVI